MLSLQTVEPDTLELLRTLMGNSLFDGTRLVGGTALALQYGHRQSVDLDFFGTISDDIEAMQSCLRSVGKLQIIKETERIRVYQVNGIKVDIIDYSRYPWISDAIEEDGLRLAAPQDIAAMKVNAIEGRGTKKDFVDMFFLLQHYSLNEILNFYAKKYAEHSIFRALMSLTYFDDADGQPMPKMFKDVVWNDIKQSIICEAKNYQ